MTLIQKTIGGLIATLLIALIITGCGNDNPVAPDPNPNPNIVKPLSPSDLTVVRETNTRISLNWQDNSDNESGFVISRTDPSKSAAVMVDTVVANVNQYRDESVSADMAYSYVVWAFNDAGSSEVSNTATVAAVAAKVADLRMIGGTFAANPQEIQPGESLSLTAWTVANIGDTNAHDFEVGVFLSTDATIDAADRLLESRSFVVLGAGGQSTFNQTSATVPSDVAPGAYYIGILADHTDQVQEADEANNSISTALTVNQLLEAPDAPTGLIATDLGGLEVGLQWIDNSDNETGFEIIVHLLKGLRDTLKVAENTTSALYTVSDEGNYSFEVRAMNDAGSSDFTQKVVVQVVQDVVVNAPSNLRVQVQDNYVIQIAWDDNSDNETSFEVLFIVLPVGSSFTVDVPANQTKLLYQLPGAGKYQVTVRARNDNAGVNSDHVNPVTVDVVAQTAPKLPDLHWDGVPYGSNVGTVKGGESISLRDWKMINTGDTVAVFAMRIYLAPGSSDPNQIASAGNIYSERGGLRLDPNEYWLVADPVIIPNTDQESSYMIMVELDPDNEVVESNETNNRMMYTVDVEQPKLADFAGVFLNLPIFPSDIRPGDSLSLENLVFKNYGDSAAVMTLGLYAAKGSPDLDVMRQNHFERELYRQSVQPGQTVSLTGQYVHLPKSYDYFTYTVMLVADYGNEVTEHLESNNQLTITMSINPTPRQPDLYVTAPNVAEMDDEVQAGDNLRLFQWVAENIGEADANSCLLRVFLSTDPSLTTQDQAIGNAQQVPAIAQGVKWNINPHNVTIPESTPPGDYYIGVWIDHDQRVDESDENNNWVSGPITILSPDPPLAPTNITACYVSWDSVTICWQDNSDDEEFFRVRYADNGALFGVKASDAAANSTSLTVPVSSHGLWYFSVTANNQYGESKDREWIDTIVPLPSPDFVIDQDTFVVIPRNITYNSSVTVSDFILRNVGPQAAPVSELWYYMSPTPEFTGSGLVLKKVIVSSLNGNNAGIKFNPTTLTIPPPLPTFPPGTYYIGVMADAKEQVYELHEDNNWKSFKVILK